MDRRDDYSARTSYDDPDVVEPYEALRFGGALGRYRWRREQAAVRRMIDKLPTDVSILDCPCGTGRWWPLLSRRAREIHGVDIAPTMLAEASQRAAKATVPIALTRAEVENLPFADASYDYSFCFALTKHLPRRVQYRAVEELARVSSRGVICTFGVLGHISYEFWRRRKLTESYPLVAEELDWIADAAGLVVRERIRCTTPVGVEFIVRFEPRSTR